MGRPPRTDHPQDVTRLLQRVGSNLTSLREERGFSQAELARRSGISVTTVNEIETRQSRDIRLSTLSALAGALGVETTRLLEKSDLELTSHDQAQLLRASEAILRITRKLRS